MPSESPVTASEPKIDGRSERRRRGREAVVDAMMDLLGEGRMPPTADEVSARAGVSTATLFRYFPTLDELRAETIARFAQRHDPLYAVPDLGDGDLDGRIARLVDARVTLFETVAPVARFARQRAAEQPQLSATLDARRALMTDQIRTHFAAEVDRRASDESDDLVDTVAVVTSFEAWELATSAGRSRADIVRAWTSALKILLG